MLPNKLKTQSQYTVQAANQTLILKNRPILVKSVNLSLKLELIKNAFHLKNTSYLISIDRTIEKHNIYRALLNQKKELEKDEMLGESEFKYRGPPWDQKKYKNQEEATLTKSTKNLKKLFFFYTNAES